MPDAKPDKKLTVWYLLGRAFLWAFVIGLGISVILYGLAVVFGDSEKTILIALYWGPITAVFIFIGVLFFLMPRAMQLSKGAFAFYLLFVTLPLLGLGALFLWWLFSG